MLVKNKPQRTIWLDSEKDNCVRIIDQRFLPHEFKICEIQTVEEAFRAIADMQVRGAPLIGVTAAFGMYLATLQASDHDFDSSIKKSAAYLISARPTAVNLAWAVNQQLQLITQTPSPPEKRRLALENALRMAEADVETCRKIGIHGLEIIQNIYAQKKRPVQILTHCNAGWLACVDWGTATSPIYHAYNSHIPLHIWVDETRPRNQGASLTAWELEQQNIPYTLIADNTGGHLMQHNQVDMVIVGTDRTTKSGDVANKIGTYLKALAAHDNQIPFYAAVPSSSIDWNISDGMSTIEIEERNADEVKYIRGLTRAGKIEDVLISPLAARAVNYGFDVTPARLVSGLITERGTCAATEKGLLSLFPEKK